MTYVVFKKMCQWIEYLSLELTINTVYGPL